MIVSRHLWIPWFPRLLYHIIIIVLLAIIKGLIVIRQDCIEMQIKTKAISILKLLDLFSWARICVTGEKWLFKVAVTCLGLRSSGGRGRRTQERARSHLCQIQTKTIIILMMMKMMMSIMIMINLAKRASPLSPIVRAILAIPKYSKFGLHTFGCNKHKVFYVST